MRSFKMFMLVAGVALVLTRLLPAAPPDQSGAEAERMLTLINTYRAGSGVAALQSDPLLQTVAAWEVADMVAHDYTGHTDSQGRDFARRFASFNIIRGWMGENVASGYASAEEALTAFEHSPGHNANLLRPVFTRVGIARLAAPFGYQRWRWAVTFGDEALHDTH